MFFPSDRLNWFKTTLFFQFFKNHTPVDTILDVLYMYPRCGEHKDRYPCILSAYFSRRGSAALTINPPILWAMKVSLPSYDPGQDSRMYWCTSSANLRPISKMSTSDSLSFAYEHKNSASGRAIEIMFLNILTSYELPWKPWHRTKRCMPL